MGFALALGWLSTTGCQPNRAVESPQTPRANQAPARFPRPKEVRGVYVTAWKAGESKMLGNLLTMLGRTEINSIVVDIRDAGYVYFDGDLPLSRSSGALRVAVPKPQRLMSQLEAAKLYPIARIACFRDDFVPKKHPELGVCLKNGRPWKDGGGHLWLDPYNRKNWDYLASIVDLALDLGFPEIQLDYVRFPSEGAKGTQVFPAQRAYPDQKAGPDDVILAFANFMGERVRKRGARYTADIFGIISSTKGDQGIGQTLEKIAQPFDVICPMVYPSHFAAGEYGIANPNRSPYAIVKKSLADFRLRVPKQAVRPWLQDFSLGVAYGKAEVRAQIKAARELGYSEYLLWNPKGRYTEAAIKDNSDLKVIEPSAKKPNREPKLPRVLHQRGLARPSR